MEKVVPKERLMVLLNAMEGGEFTVKEPFFDTTLLDVSKKGGRYEVKLSGKNDFGPFPSEDEYWDVDDLPGFYDYKDCLISSGLVHFDNWDEFKGWIEELHEAEIDPTMASQSVFLTIDTNMAYFRLISRRFPLETDGVTVTAEDFDHLLSSIVEGEVDHYIKGKYGESELKMMGMYTDIGDIRFNFRNRGKLKTRKAKFATQELNYLRGELNAARVKATSSKTDAEENDIRIVESIERFSWDRNIVPALISSDRNMGNHAENCEIPHFILEIPGSIPRKNEVGSGVVMNLLHDLALTFGAVKIPEIGTTLFGIWGGKRDVDYENESVKVWVNPGSGVRDVVKRELDIMDAIS